MKKWVMEICHWRATGHFSEKAGAVEADGLLGDANSPVVKYEVKTGLAEW